MASFLRKKSKAPAPAPATPVKTQPPPPRPVEPASPGGTPLFARFASATSANTDPSSSPRPVVSEPMMLTSRKESQSKPKPQVVVPAGPSKTQVQVQEMLRRDDLGPSSPPRRDAEKPMSSPRSPSFAGRSPISITSSSPQAITPKTRLATDKPLPNPLPPSDASKPNLPSFGSSPPASPVNKLGSLYETLPSGNKSNNTPSVSLSQATSHQGDHFNSTRIRSVSQSQQSGYGQPDPRNSQKKRQSLTKDSLHGESSKVSSDYDVSSSLFNGQTPLIDGAAGPPSAFRKPATRKSSLPSQSSSNSNDSHNLDDFDLWLKSTDSQSSDATDFSSSSSPPQVFGSTGISRKASRQSVAPVTADPEPKTSAPVVNGPIRGKPLIFSAMSVPEDELSGPDKLTEAAKATPSHQDLTSSYPSPPAEFSPLLPSIPNLPIESHRGPAAAVSAVSSSPPRDRREISPLPADSNRRQSVLSTRGRSSVQAPLSLQQTTSTPPHPPRKPSSSHRDAPPNGQSHGHRLTKPRPTTPTKQRPSTPKNRPVTPVSPERKASVVSSSPERRRFSGALIDDDPFAKTQSIRMLKPSSRDGPPPSRGGLSSREGLFPTTSTEALPIDDLPPSRSTDALSGHTNGSFSPEDLHSSSGPTGLTRPSTGKSSMSDKPIEDQHVNQEAQLSSEVPRAVTPPLNQQNGMPVSPATPEEYRAARTKRRGGQLEKTPPSVVQGITVRQDRPAEPFPLASFLEDPILLSSLITYLSYYEWCNLSSISKSIRTLLTSTRLLKEEILERYLHTVGYSRWVWPEREPLSLSLGDLHNYMRGVTLPTHEYARVAELVVQSMSVHPSQRDESVKEKADQMVQATRAYNRVLLRLRAQAEKELNGGSSAPSSFKVNFNYSSRASSRAPSPTRSTFSHGGLSNANNVPQIAVNAINAAFSSASRSPLFRIRRAPLLRVFVPSSEGDWLSDASVLECEAELKLARIRDLIRFGDVVWDIAVGDEGNVGRMIWDGSYLIDLDYTYSTVGDLPKYIPALAFPPSYFHRVIRTGPSSTNPIIRIDLSPWGPEIAANLQLLQDRVRTETPQGSYHNVVRWVHRSSFVMRPGLSGKRSSSRSRNSPPSTSSGRIPIPDTNGLFVDPGWYGTIVVETEGTNESLADLQDRCGPGAFPPRAPGIASNMTAAGKVKEKDSKMVFRILRERSRPGEIWIRAASVKERLM
ncbi:hypothetical protein Moror_7982 [Moniliophthora roreri MCA 2997]|uniref:Uncharacterized protein n=2 Tax=Moniliophthora roreri TaxID=221103 RepID=V2XPP1_MONRO|nr:hypothetical protein Moror_7982 [Moniliophthora roreri MCA 2997]KAI3610511.1 hypothetical protein WG66_006920 [Moniliophthora roreri]